MSVPQGPRAGGKVGRLAAWLVAEGALYRYLLVGALISLLDLSLFTVFSGLFRFPSLAANIGSTLISVCVSYLINRVWVFRAERASWTSFFSFAGVTLVTGLVLQSAVIWAILWVAEPFTSESNRVMVLVAAKILAMGCGALANYLGYRVIFRRRSDA